MTIEELKEFVRKNNLTIHLLQIRETYRENGYCYEGYQGSKLLFTSKEFTVKKTLYLHPIGAKMFDSIENLNHADWLYSMFMEYEGMRPLDKYAEGMRQFIKALNLYGPPVLWQWHEGAKLQIITDNFNAENGFTFYLAGQAVAEISPKALITPSRLRGPANLLMECKASFRIMASNNYIMDIYWPS